MPKIVKIFLYFYAALLLFVFTHHSHAQDKVQKIDELIQKYNALGQLNGAVLVAEGGKIIYCKGIGYADFENKIFNKPDTKFRLASVTKQFTSALILQLVEKGKIKLDGKLSEYLPYYRKDVGEKITIEQILSHTAGLTNYTDSRKFIENEVNNPADPKSFVLKYCSDDLAFTPGSDWAYSNSGYFILGLVIEEVTGKKFEEVLQENILIPLGMTNSGVEKTGTAYENYAKGYQNLFGELKPSKEIEMTVPYSAGAMYSTVEDMFKWDQALYTEKILKKESIEKMFTPVKNDYGFGWHVGEQPIGEMKKKAVLHSGGIFGFNSLVVRLIDDKHFIVALNNVENGSLNPLSIGIANILYGLEAAQPREDLSLVLMKNLKEKNIEEVVSEIRKLKEDREKYRANENNMNNLGYTMLQQGKIKEAVEIFKLNVEWFPESSNVYDSYGEALAAAGDIENAIKNYKKSIELNPNNEGGKEMLKKLQEKK